MKKLCFTLSLLLGLNIAVWSNTADSSMRKAPIPLNLPLSGTVTGNQYQKGSSIESTQVIESGTTTYLAEEDVVLNAGFEVKAGAEFEVMFDRDSFHIVNLMTYNIWIRSTNKYKDHANVIKKSKADVVSVQEIKGETRFNNILKKNCGYEGTMCVTTTKDSHKYGIGMLWNPNTMEKPIDIDSKTVTTPNDGSDPKRAYIVAEFRDFCFVATHYSLDQEHRKEMTNQILQHRIVQKCTAMGKPVYVAGDMNEQPEDDAIKIFTDNGYQVLNILDDYNHATRPQRYIDKKYIDLILEYNKTPYHKIIDRGIPIPQKERDTWIDNISDHFPYSVKLKVQ